MRLSFSLEFNLNFLRMTENAQGTSGTPDGVDEVSINGLLDGIRGTKGYNATIATAITSLNKREASNYIKLSGDINNNTVTIIDTLSRKIDDAVTGIKGEVAALSNRLNTEIGRAHV